MGPSPTYHPPEGEECETSVEHGLPLWAKPAVGYSSRRPRPSPMSGSRFVGARAVGPWVGEQKPLGKSPMRGNPSPESTYLPTYLSDTLTTVNQASGGLSAQQAAYNDHLHAHIPNIVDSHEEDRPSSTQAPTQVSSDMLLMIQQVDTHLAQLYARTACGEQLSPAALHQCKQLLEWRAQVAKN